MKKLSIGVLTLAAAAAFMIGAPKQAYAAETFRNCSAGSFYSTGSSAPLFNGCGTDNCDSLFSSCSSNASGCATSRNGCNSASTSCGTSQNNCGSAFRGSLPSKNGNSFQKQGISLSGSNRCQSRFSANANTVSFSSFR